MTCYLHSTIPAGGACADCGRALCSDCLALSDTPICQNCVSVINIADQKRQKRELVWACIGAAIGILVVLNTAAFSFGVKLFLCYAVCMIPFVWQKLPKIPVRFAIFFLMPVVGWMGWLFYFMTKLMICYISGIFLGPYFIYKLVVKNRERKELQADLAQRAEAARLAHELPRT